jgi:hypothetical protein
VDYRRSESLVRCIRVWFFRIRVALVVAGRGRCRDVSHEKWAELETSLAEKQDQSFRQRQDHYQCGSGAELSGMQEGFVGGRINREMLGKPNSRNSQGMQSFG